MTDWYWPNSIVYRVIDGDTIVASLKRDLGFNGTVSFQQHLRLNRINAAPVKTDLGAAAKQYVIDCTHNFVQIETLKAYKYGDEWMAEVELSDGVNLSDALVREGFAEYWTGHGPRPLGEAL